MPAISVIIPVYNVALYLPRCLESLMRQTLADIELICIDDKSTDDSLSILREYEKKDERIIVIDMPQNGGAAIARNAGLNVATGNYVAFVDPDDFVDLNFYEKLYIAAMETKADIVKGEILTTDLAGHTSLMRPSAEEVKQNKFNFSCSWTSAIYRHGMIKQHNLYFDVSIATGQDTIFLLKAVFFANYIELVSGVYYHYIRRDGSLDSAILSTSKVQFRIDAVNIKIDFLNEHVMDSETYVNVYRKCLYSLLYPVFNRCETLEGAFLIVQYVIKAYADKCKFPREYEEVAIDHYVGLIKNKQAMALFGELILRDSNLTTAYKERLESLEIHVANDTLTRRLFAIYNTHSKKHINILGLRFSFKRKAKLG